MRSRENGFRVGDDTGVERLRSTLRRYSRSIPASAMPPQTSSNGTFRSCTPMGRAASGPVVPRCSESGKMCSECAVNRAEAVFGFGGGLVLAVLQLGVRWRWLGPLLGQWASFDGSDGVYAAGKLALCGDCRSGVMNNFSRDRRSPLGLFPGRPAPRLCDRVVPVSGETRRIRRGHRSA